MFDIEITEKKGIRVIDSKLLHKKLEVASYHSDWIRRRIDNYGFEEGKDYFLDHLSTVRGGQKRKDYLLSLDMAKELSMIENSSSGKMVREYFINIEKKYFKLALTRAISIETRKTLTESVKDSGENERMHGHGYSQYTNMVYEITGLKERYKKHKNDIKNGTMPKHYDFRSTAIGSEELKRVELAESLIKPLLELDKQYSEIKDTLKPLFETKSIKDK